MNTTQYWNDVRDRICPRCVDGDGTGRCLVDPAVGCALQTQLPLVIDSVMKVRSERVSDYIAEIRRTVCDRCQHQSADGTCTVRASLDCALDRYLPLVIQIIEDVKERQLTIPTHP